ncbi:MAG: hypothetical protein JWP57_3244 [Spirosoma sp.]|nr:hypothetical protein [Spirosoma sp.]
MKPLQLPSANGLQLTPEETAGVIGILYRVGFEAPTSEDRQFAQEILLKAYLTYPEYANYPKSGSKGIRPDQRSRPPFNGKR